MPNVIAVHAVENFDTWLREDNRPGLFKQFSSGYRLYRLSEKDKVAIVWENVDIAKLQSILGSAEAERGKRADTVLDTIELFVELEGPR